MGPQSGLLANRYELTSLIAGGGVGQVWRARDTRLDRLVAVKLLRDQFAGDTTFLTRFRAEAQHTAHLSHPNIVAVSDYGEVPAGPRTPPLAFLVMELVDGESLAQVIRREGRLDAQRTLHVLRQAAAGLAAAHAAGVVHRDIKPANLLVGPDGTVKLTDFGIARSATSVALTGTGQVVGTAHYLSPEQASGQSATPASDVYALGAVGYECLTGRRAFEGESPVQVAIRHIREEPDPLPADVPPAVRTLVERAMAKDPSVRYPDAAALQEAVERVIAGAPIDPPPPAHTAVLPVAGPATLEAAAPTAVVPESARRRRPRALPAVLGAAAVLVALLVAMLLGGSPATEADDDPAPSTPAGVEVVAETLVGRPVRDVQVELIGQGLQVELVPVETSEVPAGRVTAVDPVGTLAPGGLVRVTYSVPPVPAPAPAPQPVGGDGEEEGQGNGDEGGGNGAEGGGNGKEGGGNGKGKGKGKGNG